MMMSSSGEGGLVEEELGFRVQSSAGLGMPLDCVFMFLKMPLRKQGVHIAICRPRLPRGLLADPTVHVWASFCLSRPVLESLWQKAAINRRPRLVRVRLGVGTALWHYAEV